MSAGTENLVAKFHRKILCGCLKIEKCIRGLLFATPCTWVLCCLLYIGYLTFVVTEVRFCFLHVDNVNGYCFHVSYTTVAYSHISYVYVRWQHAIYLQTVILLLNLHHESFYARILSGLESPSWKSKVVSSPSGLCDTLQPKSNMKYAA